MANIKKRVSPLNAEHVLCILNKISIFAGLSQAQIDYLFKLLEEVSYEPGEIIFEQGSEPTHIYIVLSGKVKLIVDKDSNPFELVVFEPGCCFGEASIIGIMHHSATTLAIEKTDLVVLSRKTLLSLYKTDLELFSILILNIAREVCRRLHKSEEIMLHYAHRQ